MEYSKIIAVTGLPGLYELLSSKSDGAIVRSLEDKSTKFVSSRIHNFSHLESIEVFTVRENVNLADVFHAMEKEEHPVPDGKDNTALKQYFDKVYPDLDFERVYTSDLKKMVKWFEVLKANEIEIKISQEQPAEEAENGNAAEEMDVEVTEPPTELAKEEKAPAKKKASPKAKATEQKEESEVKEVKPKKAASKKKKEDI